MRRRDQPSSSPPYSRWLASRSRPVAYWRRPASCHRAVRALMKAASHLGRALELSVGLPQDNRGWLELARQTGARECLIRAVATQRRRRDGIRPRLEAWQERLRTSTRRRCDRVASPVRERRCCSSMPPGTELLEAAPGRGGAAAPGSGAATEPDWVVAGRSRAGRDGSPSFSDGAPETGPRPLGAGALTL